MSEHHESSTPRDSSLTPRKAVERAIILPLIGLLLLAPPIAGIFEIQTRLSGIPFTVIYLFSVWGLLIFSAYRLSRRLQNLDDQYQETEGPHPAEREQKP